MNWTRLFVTVAVVCSTLTALLGSVFMLFVANSVPNWSWDLQFSIVFFCPAVCAILSGWFTITALRGNSMWKSATAIVLAVIGAWLGAPLLTQQLTVTAVFAFIVFCYSFSTAR